MLYQKEWGIHPAGELLLDRVNPFFRNLASERQQLYRGFAQEAKSIQYAITGLSANGFMLGAHGTNSLYLESILRNGLGALMPKGALHKTKSLTDATMLDGMVGAYLFAKGDMDSTLAIHREEIDPRGDMVERYIQLSPAIKSNALRAQLERYFAMRRQITGKEYTTAYPVQLVVATEEKDKMKIANPAVPSELEYEGVFPPQNIVLLCVPQAKITQTQALVDQYTQLKVHAIEPLELF